ncbi:MAG: Glutathione S-transferase domain [Hyphomicrobiales bacterium]|nr:Glutathione S-transferase domain [Hyphomicrobiales bacterium]
MATLFHHPLCPRSRFVRVLLGEYGIEPDLIEERPYERRRDFLIANPAGELPVLVEQNDFVVPGAAVIAEYLDETRGLAFGEHRLLPERPAGRVEVRRLTEWFNLKFYEEVSGPLVSEKVYKRFMTSAEGGGAPDMNVVRAARANIRYHLRYIGYLTSTRKWLAGDQLSHADLAAAAHLSCADFVGDVPWGEDEAAKDWYTRMKSRPSFRAILNDRLPGMTPAAVYADLDF